MTADALTPTVLNVAPKPFSPHMVQESAPAGSTILQMVTRAVNAGVLDPEDLGLVVAFVDGEPLAGDTPEERRAQLAFVPPTGSTVMLAVQPQGGSNGQARTGLQFALMAVAIVASFTVGPFTASLWALAANIVPNLLFPLNVPNTLPDGNDRGALQDHSNTLRKRQMMPLQLSTADVSARVGLDVAALPYSRLLGNDVWLQIILGAHYGPCTIADIKIGETLLADYPAGDIQVETFATPGPRDSALYPGTVHQENLTDELTFGGDFEVHTTTTSTRRIEVDLTWPGGLRYTKENGTTVPQETRLQIEWRPVGGSWAAAPLEGGPYRSRTGTFLPTGTVDVQARTNDPVRRTFAWETGGSGQYDVRIKAWDPDGDDASRAVQDVVWSALKSIDASRKPILDEMLSVVVLSVRSSEDLGGSLPTVTAVVTPHAPTYTGAGWDDDLADWTPATSPVALTRMMLLGPAAAQPVTSFDPSCDDVHELCVENGWMGSARLDSDVTQEDALKLLGAMGRFSVYDAGEGLCFSPDWHKAAPRQQFGDTNVQGYQLTRSYPDPCHAVVVEFVNVDADGKADELYVYADGYDETNAQLLETYQLPYGCTPARAFKEGRVWLAKRQLLVEGHEWTASAESIACSFGDWIRLQHPTGGNVLEDLEVVDISPAEGETARIRAVRYMAEEIEAAETGPIPPLVTDLQPTPKAPQPRILGVAQATPDGVKVAFDIDAKPGVVVEGFTVRWRPTPGSAIASTDWQSLQPLPPSARMAVTPPLPEAAEVEGEYRVDVEIRTVIRTRDVSAPTRRLNILVERVVDPVVDFSAEGVIRTSPDSSTYPAIAIFAAPVDAVAVQDLVLEVRPAASSSDDDWVSAGALRAANPVGDITSVEGGQSYDVRARWRTTDGWVGDWEVEQDVAVPANSRTATDTINVHARPATQVLADIDAAADLAAGLNDQLNTETTGLFDRFDALFEDVHEPGIGVVARLDHHDTQITDLDTGKASVASVTTLTARARSAPNLLRNADFSRADSLDSWHTEGPGTGGRFADIVQGTGFGANTAGGYLYLVSDFYPAVAGTSYAVSADGQNGTVAMQFATAALALIGTNYGDVALAGYTNRVYGPSASAPAGTAYVRVVVFFAAGATYPGVSRIKLNTGAATDWSDDASTGSALARIRTTELTTADLQLNKASASRVTTLETAVGTQPVGKPDLMTRMATAEQNDSDLSTGKADSSRVTAIEVAGRSIPNLIRNGDASERSQAGVALYWSFIGSGTASGASFNDQVGSYFSGTGGGGTAFAVSDWYAATPGQTYTVGADGDAGVLVYLQFATASTQFPDPTAGVLTGWGNRVYAPTATAPAGTTRMRAVLAFSGATKGASRVKVNIGGGTYWSSDRTDYQAQARLGTAEQAITDLGTGKASATRVTALETALQLDSGTGAFAKIGTYDQAVSDLAGKASTTRVATLESAVRSAPNMIRNGDAREKTSGGLPIAWTFTGLGTGSALDDANVGTFLQLVPGGAGQTAYWVSDWYACTAGQPYSISGDGVAGTQLSLQYRDTAGTITSYGQSPVVMTGWTDRRYSAAENAPATSTFVRAVITCTTNVGGASRIKVNLGAATAWSDDRTETNITARLVTAEQAVSDLNSGKASVTRVSTLETRVSSPPNLLRNGNAAEGMTGWGNDGTSGTVGNDANVGTYFTGNSGGYVVSGMYPCTPGQAYSLSADGDAGAFVYLQFFTSGIGYLANGSTLSLTGWGTRGYGDQSIAPATSAYMRVVCGFPGSQKGASRIKLNAGPASTWTDERTAYSAYARVTNAESAITDLQGNTRARWAIGTAVPGADAFIEAQAETVVGSAPTSSVGIGARTVSLYSLVNGVYVPALTVQGGNVVLTGGLTAGAFIRLGSGAGWPVALRAADFNVSDGTVVSFGTDLGTLPKVDFAGNNLAPLSTGETYNLYADSLTATGFTARLKIMTPGTPSSLTGADAGVSSGKRYVNVADASKAESTTGDYTITVSGSASVYFRGKSGQPLDADDTLDVQFQVELWRKISGTWTQVGIMYVTKTIDLHAYPTSYAYRTISYTETQTVTLGTGNTNAIGVAPGTSDGTSHALSSVSASWQAAGTGSGTRSATPSSQLSRVTVRPQ